MGGVVRAQHWHCLVAVHDAPHARVRLLVDQHVALDAPLSRQHALAGAAGEWACTSSTASPSPALVVLELQHDKAR